MALVAKHRIQRRGPTSACGLRLTILVRSANFVATGISVITLGSSPSCPTHTEQVRRVNKRTIAFDKPTSGVAARGNSAYLDASIILAHAKSISVLDVACFVPTSSYLLPPKRTSPHEHAE